MADGKKRGRPPLSPEEKAKRQEARRQRDAERFKANGYAYQKQYRERHPERVREQGRKRQQRYRDNGVAIYEPKVRIPLENKPVLEELLRSTGMTITQLFAGAVEEKYGVTLLKPIDNGDKP